MQIQLGKGDVAIMLATNDENRSANGIAFVRRNAEYLIAVDVDCDVTNEEIENGTLGYIFFSNPKSIDAVINQLNKLKEKYGQYIK
ncbi:hypothetical protein [Paenibacillus naphthalenovorans]|uniref:Uncharacterized protein n=1 Tax=Paenibacillus naphthalenovorans TaxID=162209 RepID=A0A0U2W429_9BACL|nr:hypothetical protein [Paenibacillus naphthalenovorans]ALS22173.1 hypothetical protein IJ22_17990 [Paenibacillus naphthalenovorans]